MKKDYQPLTPRNSQQAKDKNKVKVILRIRPFQEQIQDPQYFLFAQDQTTVMVNKPGYPSFMKFNYVQAQKQPKKQSQQNIFHSVKQAVQCIFEGIDATIFAYGQTGAGKTYTIVGHCPDIDSQNENYKLQLLSNERGILPRALQRILEEQSIKKDSRITISFFQIYNQKIFDLLNSTMRPLQIRQTKSGELSIPGLSFAEVVNMKEVTNYLAQGIRNRVTSSTQANITSSRSHSIFHVKYERLIVNESTGQHEVLVANLRIVDLAGSQKFNVPQDIPQAEKQIKFLELKSINGSLSKLGHCISALGSQSRSHIPFRDSKLTRILSDSLMGPGKIRLIICVSPSISAMHETSSTLQFADRVKKAVFERPTLSVQKKKTVDLEEFKQLEKQLKNQTTKRIEIENMLKQFLKSKNFQEEQLLKENYKLRQEVAFLKQQIKIYSSKEKLQKEVGALTKVVNNGFSSKSPINSVKASSNRKPLQSSSRLKTSLLKSKVNETSINQFANKSTRLKQLGQNKYSKIDKNSTKNICYQICS